MKRTVARELLDLALPVIGLNVLNVLALVVDTAMCGRLPDAENALTALGFATQMIFLLLVAMIGVSVGTVALVSRAHGAGHDERVNHVLLQSTQLTVLVGLVVGGVGYFFGGNLIALLGAEGEVLALADSYLKPMFLGTVFYYLSILYAGVLRGVGNTRLPFVVAVVSNLLNVVFNYGLILGNFGLPQLGVEGAAIGTVLSNVVAVVLMIALLRRGAQPGLFVPLRPAAIDRELAWRLFRVGGPAALDMVILNAAFLSIVGFLGRIDPVAVAAHGIGLRIQALAFVPGMSVSQATGAMVGQALGAGDPGRAREVVRASVVLSVAIMSTLAIAIVFMVDPIISIFDVNPAGSLHALSRTWIELLGYGMPIVGVHIAFIGMLQGAGATNQSLAINFVGTVVFQIPLSLLLGFTFGWGVYGIWLAFPLSFVVKALLGTAAYRRGTWARVGATV